MNIIVDLLTQLLEIVKAYQAGFIALAGIAAFVPALINLLKTFHVVGEDKADEVQAVINAFLFLAFIGVRTLFPDFNVGVVDSVVGQVAAVIVMVLTFLGQFGLSRLAYKRVWKGRFGALGYYHS